MSMIIVSLLLLGFLALSLILDKGKIILTIDYYTIVTDFLLILFAFLGYLLSFIVLVLNTLLILKRKDIDKVLTLGITIYNYRHF